MRKSFFIFIFLVVAGSLAAQDDNLTFQFSKILFDDLVDTIEREIPVKIYYSPKWTDSLTFNINASNSSLEGVLDNALRREGLLFMITDDNKIILSKGYSIKTGFSREYSEYLEKNYAEAARSIYMKPPSETEESAISDEYRLFRIGRPSAGAGKDRVTLTGVVTDADDGEVIPSVVVYVDKLKSGAMTNNVGYYSITLPPGQYRIEYRMIGMKTAGRNVQIYSDGALDVSLTSSPSELNEVLVSANRENNVRNSRIGIEKINMKMIRQIPLGLGEADLLKSSLMLPGIQTVGEASAGFNVRGGSTDQNLVLLNYAPIINSSHFFGFFSAFNSDLITDVTLFKSGMPARYGGRLSSVMEIIPLEGNREKLKVSGGISPVTGRLMAEGPLVKDKVSFVIGARTTYSDWLLGMLDDARLSNSTAGFQDLQGAINADINDRNSVSLSGYYSNDRFDYFMESGFKYGNLAATMKWKHSFGRRLSAQFFAIMSNYKYQLTTKSDSTEYNNLWYELNQKIARADFTFNTSDVNKMEFGLDATLYTLYPGRQEPFGDYSTITASELQMERALEPSVYISDELDITPRFSITAGIRGTLYTSFGPRRVYLYYDDLPRSVETISDTLTYGNREIINFFPGLDFRFSSRFLLSPRSSVKIGAQRAFQYLHMISNTTSMSPVDIWKLSDTYIKPQRGDQVSAGYYMNFDRRAIETSVEAYYKWMKNALDYKGGAELLMNEYLETDILNGDGKAYGVELMVKKQSGRVTGWISYTWSRVFMKVDGSFEEEKVNGGNYFPATYDKPHDLKLVINAKASRRFNITSNFVYSSGRPISYPVAFYNFYNSSHVYYSLRNDYRIPYYMRLDLSATLNGNLKVRKLNHSSFTATVYNVLGRKNPYSIFFKNENGEVKGYQMTIFARPIFMLTYNFRLFGNASGDF
jgi:hypothetical protein